MTERTPSIGPTTLRSVLTASVIGAGLAAVAGQATILAGGTLLQPGPGGWVPVGILAAVMGWLAWTTGRTLHVKRAPLAADVALVRLRLAKAGALVAAAVGGAYLALTALSWGGWPAPLAQTRVLHSLLSTASCLVWLVAALALEKACRIPIDSDEL